MLLSLALSVPLGLSMLVVGSISIQSCSGPPTETNLTLSSSVGDGMDLIMAEAPLLVHIPVWLTVSGGLLLLAPSIYFIYDKFCKAEDVNTSQLTELVMSSVTCYIFQQSRTFVR